MTSVQDYSEWADFLVLQQMEREGALKVRVSEWLTFNDSPATLAAERAQHDVHDPMLHTAMLKGLPGCRRKRFYAGHVYVYQRDDRNPPRWKPPATTK